MSVREISTNIHNYLGNLIVSTKSKLSPNKQYGLEIIVRLPMLFLIHQWMLLAPFSQYTILEIPLIVARGLGAVIIFGCQEVEKVRLLLIYSTLMLDVMVGWLVDTSYWLIYNEATGECTDETRLTEGLEDYWWSPLFVVAVTLTVYMMFLNYRYERSEDLRIFFTFISACVLFLHTICTAGFFLYVLSPVYYYGTKISLSLISVTQVCVIIGEDEKYVRYGQENFRNFREILPGPWVSRDLNATFAVIYFCSCFILDVMTLGIEETMTIKHAIGLIGRWTTTSVILGSLASALCTLSNFAVAISRFLVIGSVNFREAFAVNVGSKLFLNTFTLSLQVGVLSRSEIERSENMAFILLLSLCLIVCQLWDLSSHHFLSLLNSGELKSWVAYMRVVIFAMVIVTGPTYFNYYLAKHYQFDLWMLLNVTGVVALVSRALLSAVEFSLVSISWYTDDTNDIISDSIYYTRLLKTLVHILCLALTSYYRLFSPYFDGPFIFSLILVILDYVALSYLLLVGEWRNFQQRRNLIKNIELIPNATEDQLSNYENDCAVCFGELQSGKWLTCGHIFHTDCLKKWLQVKSTCPYCNVALPNL